MRTLASATLLQLALAVPVDAAGTAPVGFDASLTFPFDEPTFASACNPPSPTPTATSPPSPTASATTRAASPPASTCVASPSASMS